MRTLRLHQVAGLLASALGLLGTVVPSAHATEANVVVFQGSAQGDTGFGYPCGGSLTLDIAKCPHIGNGGPLVVNGVNGTCPVHTVCGLGGNTVGFTFASNVCVSGSDELFTGSK